MIIKTFESKIEWLEWRKQGVCASDIPKILNMSKWGNIDECFKEKTETVENKDNWAKQRGREFEPIIRARLEKDYDCELEVLCGEHRKNDWARASFDAINFHRGILAEIKVAGKDDHDTARQGLVPVHYYPQVQWQLYVSGFSEARYVSAFENKETGWEIQEVLVQRNDAYIDKHMQKIMHFWNCVQTGMPPTDPLSDDIQALFKTYARLYDQATILEERMSEIKGIINDITPSEGSLSFAGFKSQWITKKGNIDYKRIKELEFVDLEKFRKDSTVYCDLRKT